MRETRFYSNMSLCPWQQCVTAQLGNTNSFVSDEEVGEEKKMKKDKDEEGNGLYYIINMNEKTLTAPGQVLSSEMQDTGYRGGENVDDFQRYSFARLWWVMVGLLQNVVKMFVKASKIFPKAGKVEAISFLLIPANFSTSSYFPPYFMMFSLHLLLILKKIVALLPNL